MMYRRHAAQHSAKSFDNIATKADATTGSLSGFFAALLKMGVFAEAERENRRRNRYAKRHSKYTSYMSDNGERAKARRRRQIACGSLRVENGLIA